MSFWFAYSAGLIAVLVIAMLSEGIEKIITAKVASALLLAAYLFFGGPFAESENKIAEVSETIALNKNGSIRSTSSEPIQSTKEINPLKYQSDPSVVETDTASRPPGIDFTPICGGGDYGDGNRLDIARLGKEQGNQQNRC
jgi:hypothetical protein